MDSGPTHKVRLVRCPKCRMLLPEPADICVYKCGGCGTVLQVKNRKNDTKSNTSGLHESEAATMNEFDSVSEVGECSSSSQKAILPSSGKCSLDQNDGMDKKIYTDCSTDNSGVVNSSDEYQNNERDHKDSQVYDIKQPGVSNEFCSSNEDANHESKELSQFARANSEVELDDMSSLREGEKMAIDINHYSNSILRSSNSMARRENNSTVASPKEAAESRSSGILISSPDGRPNQFQMSANLRYEQRDFFSPRSDFSSKSEYSKFKSPTIRSSHEYDGSVSSYDGTDDHAPEQHISLHKNTFNVVNSVISEERSRRDKFLGNSNMNGNSKMQHQASNLSSALPGKGPYTAYYRGYVGHGLTGGNGASLQDEEFPSPLHFNQRNYPAGYECGSTSSQLQNEFHHHSSEQEKIKLLRMVYELQDQLNKACHVNENPHRTISSGVTRKEKCIPSNYTCEIPEDEFSHELNYRRYPERCRQVRNWPHQYKVSRIPFSGEATNNSHLINSSYTQCYPQCSAPILLPFLPHNKGFCRFHPCHSCSHSYTSCPSSPQHFTDSEIPIWCRETKSGDLRHGDHHMKKYKREKHHLAKRHLRPTAGGAPFLTCYRCLIPLQLPADFLVFRRRFHLLRCGGCSEVLKFSLEKRTHIVPYTPENVALPRSRPDDYGDAINRRNSVSSFRGNNFSPADPVSCSDDYGLSCCRSYSTDGDPIILAPFHNHQDNRDARNMSYDSFESMKDRSQIVLKQFGNKYKTSVETQESAGPSSFKSKTGKVFSEIQELSAKTGSPLHQLMGYSSLSQALRGSDPSGSGTS